MKNKGPSERMKQNIRNVYWLYVVLFAALLAYLSYFMLFTSKQIVGDSHNPRLAVLDKEMKRGTIYDINGHELAYSEGGESQLRKYPLDRNASHLIGYTEKGKAGIEAAYNFELQKLHNEVWQRIVQLFNGTELTANSITLTLDVDLQNTVYESLGSKKGGVIVMEPDTGKILAMASYPNYDPNTILEDWQALSESDNSPFLNRVTQGLYTPGSVFKIITAAAIIENNQNFKDIDFLCEGEIRFENKTIHCFDSKKHGEEDLSDAMANSCNTFFANEGIKIGAQKLIESAEKRLFNKPLGYRLDYNKSIFQLKSSAAQSEIVETAIGQGMTLVSPLHMSIITSAIANDGVAMQPYIVDHVTAYNGQVVSKNLPAIFQTLFTVENAQTIKHMMREVVLRGTGHATFFDDIYVAGKTGTAENPNGTSHSWFTAYAEQNGKKIVVTVVLENPENGATAVPVAKKVIQAAFYR